MDACVAAGLEDDLAQFPMGLHTPLTEGAPSLGLDTSLADALRRFDQEEAMRLPVVDYSDPPLVVAEASHLTALKTFNKALIDSQREREV